MTHTHQGSVCYPYSYLQTRPSSICAQIVRHSCAGAHRARRRYITLPSLSRTSQSFPFYLLRCYKNRVRRAATLRAVNKDRAVRPYRGKERLLEVLKDRRAGLRVPQLIVLREGNEQKVIMMKAVDCIIAYQLQNKRVPE